MEGFVVRGWSELLPPRDTADLTRRVGFTTDGVLWRRFIWFHAPPATACHWGVGF
jgi:hypothetical protein